MTPAEKSAVLQSLYFVLYEAAQNSADNAKSDQAAQLIRKEASKFLVKVQKLSKVA